MTTSLFTIAGFLQFRTRYRTFPAAHSARAQFMSRKTRWLRRVTGRGRRQIMRNLVVFNSVSLDGYFTDANGEMSWAHTQDAEFQKFVEGNAGGGGELLFGRVTYDLMAGYWPSPMAMKNDPVVAEGMNSLPKVVFS